MAEHGALCEGPCVNSTAQVDRGAGVRRTRGPCAGPSASAGVTRVAALRDLGDQEEERERAARDTIECVERCGAESRLPTGCCCVEQLSVYTAEGAASASGAPFDGAPRTRVIDNSRSVLLAAVLFCVLSVGAPGGVSFVR